MVKKTGKVSIKREKKKMVKKWLKKGAGPKSSFGYED